MCTVRILTMQLNYSSLQPSASTPTSSSSGDKHRLANSKDSEMHKRPNRSKTHTSFDEVSYLQIRTSRICFRRKASSQALRSHAQKFTNRFSFLIRSNLVYENCSFCFFCPGIFIFSQIPTGTYVPTFKDERKYESYWQILLKNIPTLKVFEFFLVCKSTPTEKSFAYVHKRT